MKTKIFKMLLPTFAIMLAVSGAFAFKNADDNALFAPETGWINLPNEPCLIAVDCQSDPNPFMCTTIYKGVTHQAFGKTSPSSCIKQLYRKL